MFSRANIIIIIKQLINYGGLTSKILYDYIDTFNALSRHIADLNLEPNSEEAQIAAYDYIKQWLKQHNLPEL